MDVTMREFLDTLPGNATETVPVRLRTYLTKQQVEAMKQDPVGHSKLTDQYLMFGDGGTMSKSLVNKIMSLKLHEPTSVLFSDDTGTGDEGTSEPSDSVLDMVWQF
jgi:hypothetical protein